MTLKPDKFYTWISADIQMEIGGKIHTALPIITDPTRHHSFGSRNGPKRWSAPALDKNRIHVVLLIADHYNNLATHLIFSVDTALLIMRVVKSWRQTDREGDHLEDPGVDGRLILNGSSKNYISGHGM
jgi:hypothetical protein